MSQNIFMYTKPTRQFWCLCCARTFCVSKTPTLGVKSAVESKLHIVCLLNATRNQMVFVFCCIAADFVVLHCLLSGCWRRYEFWLIFVVIFCCNFYYWYWFLCFKGEIKRGFHVLFWAIQRTQVYLIREYAIFTLFFVNGNFSILG